LTNAFDAHDLDAVLYVLGHFSRSVAARDKVTIGVNGVVFVSQNLSDQDLDRYISAADIVVIPYRTCYTSATLHRALQLGKFVVASRAVWRTVPTNDRILQFENEKDLPLILKKARQLDTAPLVPKTKLDLLQK
jgi:hypothetical protein